MQIVDGADAGQSLRSPNRGRSDGWYLSNRPRQSRESGTRRPLAQRRNAHRMARPAIDASADSLCLRRCAFSDSAVEETVPAAGKAGPRRLGAQRIARMAQVAAPEEPSQEKWRKLRGLGSLDRRRLAAVTGAFQLARGDRCDDESANAGHHPRRSDCGNCEARSECAERDLQVMRGLPKRDLAAIVEVVEKTRSLPLEALPLAPDREQDPPQVTLVANVLSAALVTAAPSCGWLKTWSPTTTM